MCKCVCVYMYMCQSSGNLCVNQGHDPLSNCSRNKEVYKAAISCALTALGECLVEVGMGGAIPNTQQFKMGMDRVCERQAGLHRYRHHHHRRHRHQHHRSRHHCYRRYRQHYQHHYRHRHHHHHHHGHYRPCGQ